GGELHGAGDVAAVLRGDRRGGGAGCHGELRGRGHGLYLLPAVHRVEHLLGRAHERAVTRALGETVGARFPPVLLGAAMILPARGDLVPGGDEGAVPAGGVVVDQEHVAVAVRGVVRVVLVEGEDLRALPGVAGDRCGHRGVHQLPRRLGVRVPVRGGGGGGEHRRALEEDVLAALEPVGGVAHLVLREPVVV